MFLVLLFPPFMVVEDKFLEWLKLISALWNWPQILNTVSKPGSSRANLSYDFVGVDEGPFQTELQIPLALLSPTQGLLSRIVSKYFHVTKYLLWASSSSHGAPEIASRAALF